MHRFFSTRNLVILLGTLSVASAWGISFMSTLESIKVEVSPGQVVNSTTQLTLSDKEARTHFKARVEDWWKNEDGTQSFYREPGGSDAPKRSCARWVKLNPVEAAVDPGGTLQVRVTIEVPKDAKPGGYWCALTIDEVPDPLSAPQGVGARFVASVSTGIFVYITPVKRSAKIVELKIGKNSASVKLLNDGDCPIGAEGRFEFTRPGEKIPAAVVVIPRTSILPEPVNTGIINVKLSDATTLPSGRYLVRTILDIGLDHYIGAQKEMDINRGEVVQVKGK